MDENEKTAPISSVGADEGSLSFAKSTAHSSNSNSSSTVVPKNFAISIASFSEGLYSPFSSRTIVSRRTPIFSASSLCLMSSWARYSLIFVCSTNSCSLINILTSNVQFLISEEKAAFTGVVQCIKAQQYDEAQVSVKIYLHRLCP